MSSLDPRPHHPETRYSSRTLLESTILHRQLRVAITDDRVLRRNGQSCMFVMPDTLPEATADYRLKGPGPRCEPFPCAAQYLFLRSRVMADTIMFYSCPVRLGWLGQHARQALPIGYYDLSWTRGKPAQRGHTCRQRYIGSRHSTIIDGLAAQLGHAENKPEYEYVQLI